MESGRRIANDINGFSIDDFTLIQAKDIQFVPNEKFDLTKSIRHFISFLHHKLDVPAKTLESVLRAMASSINGFGLAANIQTYTKIDSDDYPKLILPITAAGIAPALLGLFNGILEMRNSDKFKKQRKIYDAVNKGLIVSSLFMLRFVIAFYIYIVTNFGQDKKEVDGTPATLAALVVPSVLIGALNSAIGIALITMTDEQKKSKFGKAIKALLNVINIFTFSATINGLINTTDALVEEIPKTSTDPTWQVASYILSATIGGFLAAGGAVSDVPQAIIDYSSAFGLLIQLVNTIKKMTENEVAQIMLTMAFSMMLLVPAAVKIYDYKMGQKKSDYHPLPTDDNKIETEETEEKSKIEVVLEDEENKFSEETSKKPVSEIKEEKQEVVVEEPKAEEKENATYYARFFPKAEEKIKPKEDAQQNTPLPGQNK